MEASNINICDVDRLTWVRVSRPFLEKISDSVVSPVVKILVLIVKVSRIPPVSIPEWIRIETRITSGSCVRSRRVRILMIRARPCGFPLRPLRGICEDTLRLSHVLEQNAGHLCPCFRHRRAHPPSTRFVGVVHESKLSISFLDVGSTCRWFYAEQFIPVHGPVVRCTSTHRGKVRTRLHFLVDSRISVWRDAVPSTTSGRFTGIPSSTRATNNGGVYFNLWTNWPFSSQNL